MTCIAALECDGRVFLAGDSQTTWGRIRFADRQPKVWRRRGVAWGAAGDCDAWEVIRRVDVLAYAGGDPLRWVRGALIPKLRAELRQARVKGGCDILLGVGERIVWIDDFMSPSMVLCGYFAVGTGGEPALGALAVLPSAMDPRTRLRRALDASARHCHTVCPPFRIVSSA